MAQTENFDWSFSPNTASDDFLALLERQIASTSSGVQQQPQISPPMSDTSSRERSGSQESMTRMQAVGAYRVASHDDEDEDEDESEEDVGDHKRKKGKGSQAKGRTSKTKGNVGEESETGKKASGRKSTGEGKDETKLSKRKEQNRAAQRAFRERKEKHVKDLEDQVAALRAATEGQKSENENLRDLLARLQQENIQLKQSAFTFTFPNSVPTTAAKPLSPPTSIKEKEQDSPQSIFSNSSDSPKNSLREDSSGGSSSESPYDILNTINSSETPSSTTGFTSSGFNAFSSQPNGKDLMKMPSTSRGSSSDSFVSMGHNQIQLSSPEEAFNPISPPEFSFSSSAFSPSAYFPTAEAPASPSAFQLLASNPLFTSYRDPALDEQMNFFASNQLQTSPGVGGLPDPFAGGFDDFFQYGMMAPLAGSPGNIAGSSSVDAVSPGAQMRGMLNPSPSASSATKLDSTDSSATIFPGGVSEPMQQCTLALLNGTAEEGCSKETLEKMHAANGTATFGSANNTLPDEAASTFSSVSGMSSQPSPCGGAGFESGPSDFLLDKAWTKDDHDEFFGSRILVSADPKAKNTPLADVWARVKATPGFRYEDFDLDSLCTEFKGKAKCDGTGPVLDEMQVQQLIAEIPYRRKPTASSSQSGMASMFGAF